MSGDQDWPGRWNHIKRLLERTGPFAHPDFEPSPEILGFLRETCKLLVIGAGGLGCELLKDLALLGFLDIHVIDMDTIDVSNLNRQFLFRPKDVGKPKAEVAAAFINTRVPGCKVTAHFAKIQDFDESFYKGFHIVVCGLDSIVARRWINGMLVSLLNYEDGELDQSSIIPIVDGGTEGFKGNARVVLPGMTACIECTLDLFPPQVNFPLCTIAHTPRLPEHCIEYVRILLWPKEDPFGAGVAIDGDDPHHISWILQKSQERANEYGIGGVNYRLTQGVVKRIIPAVASTNAVIAAACATEVFKVASSCCHPLNNYMNFNDTEGVYTYTFEAMKREDCLVCSSHPQNLSFSESDKLQDVINFLTESLIYQMKSPGVTTSMDGKNRTLYMPNVKSIEERTRGNLKKTLKELDIKTGQELYVADVTTPVSMTFNLTIATDMETGAENEANAAN
ncbi:NEDD8-activating protein uba3 [Nucella lapillus]